MNPPTTTAMTATGAASIAAPEIISTLTTGPRTLGEMVLNAAERFTGIALAVRARRQGSCDQLSRVRRHRDRDRTGADRAWNRVRRPRRDPRIDLGRLDARRLRLALCAGAVVTPIYHTNSPEECAYVLEHSGARLVFCEDPAQAAKIAQVPDRCSSVEHVVLFEGEADGAITLDQLRAAGRAGDGPRGASAAGGDRAR